MRFETKDSHRFPGLVLWAMLSLCLASCGGSRASDQTSRRCEPSSGTVGTVVTCDVAGLGFSRESTLFFGTTPVRQDEVVFNEEEKTIELPVLPSPPGPKDISFGAGAADLVMIHRGFMVVAQPDPCATATCAAGEVCLEGECVTAGGSNPADSTTDSDNDGVLDSSDLCPGTPAGASVGADGCPLVTATDSDGDGVPDASDNCPDTSNADQLDSDGDGQGDPCDTDDDNDGIPDATDECPTAAATTPNGCPRLAPLITVTPHPPSGDRFGLVKVEWDIGLPPGQQVVEAKIWSHGFYRVPTDLSESTPCGPVSDSLYANADRRDGSAPVTRRLLVDDDGSDFNDYQLTTDENADVNRYMAKADQCDVDRENCRSYAGADRFFRTPACLIDLNLKAEEDDENRFLPHGVFYTRNFSIDTFHLYVKTSAGEESLVHARLGRLDRAVIDSVTVDSNEDSTDLKFIVDYSHAIRRMSAPVGCRTQSSYFERDGSGTLTVNCPLENFPNTLLTFEAESIGFFNPGRRQFKIELGEPQIDLVDGGNHQPSILFDDNPGTLTLKAKVWRRYTVKNAPLNTDAHPPGRTTAGISRVTLLANVADARVRVGAKAPEKGIGDLNWVSEVSFEGVTRDYSRYNWIAYFRDYEAHFSLPYGQVIEISPESDYGTGADCNAPLAWSKECDVDRVSRLKDYWFNGQDYGYLFTLRHVQRVEADCPGSFSPGPSTQFQSIGTGYIDFVPNTYGPLVTSFSGTMGAVDVTCTFTFISPDGKRRSKKVQSHCPATDKWGNWCDSRWVLDGGSREAHVQWSDL